MPEHVEAGIPKTRWRYRLAPAPAMSPSGDESSAASGESGSASTAERNVAHRDGSQRPTAPADAQAGQGGPAAQTALIAQAVSGEVTALSTRLGVPALVVELLRRRGLASFEDMDVFLSPLLRHLSPLDAWPGLQEAARLVADAVREGQPILVWGDYDVDGITGATLMSQVLEFHGATVQVHLPDRLSEGYGLNIPELERLAATGVKLLLTVDCGISDVEPVRRARELGMTVVVSDHHLPPEQLPEAHAICNPRLGTPPCPHLAGVGVAFFLMAACNAELADKPERRMDMRQVLDLVALGTLADMVKLTGENRILVKNGLLKIAEAKRPGLAELKAVSGFSPVASLGSGQVVFNLAPRINAAGRLGHPGTAFSLLRATSHDGASPLARELDAMNSARRSEEERIFDLALAQAQTQLHRVGIVLFGEDWHQGVIGIVASRVVESMNRPVLVLCRDGATLKGSGRSIPDVDLHAGLAACAHLLLAFGGHRQAAGLRLEAERLPALRDAFDEAIRAQIGNDAPGALIQLDGDLAFAEASSFETLKALELLQPFGIGNPEPVFASLPLRVRKRRLFGPKRNHVMLDVQEEMSGITLQAKAWRQADRFPESMAGQRIRLAYTPGINAFNGVAAVELRVRDWELLSPDS